MHDLEIKSIKINEIIYSELIYFLNNDENYRKEIFIENIEDLNNIKKINLYYIILNYILNNSFYIYNTDFLKKARGTIILFIKKYLYILLLITTDLSKDSREKLDFIIKAKEAGFFIRFFYVCTSDPTINVTRIAQRYINGGHEVPISKVISRYYKSLLNAAKAIAIVDRAYVYDNSVENQLPILLYRTVDGKLFKQYTTDIPRWAEMLLNH